MSHLYFNKDISYKVWDQSTFNTSKKPNLKTFFHKDFTIYSKFKIERTEDRGDAIYGIFSKCGLHSGVFVNKENDFYVVSAQLWMSKPLDAENINITFIYDFEREWQEIFFSVDYTNKILRVTYNGESKEAPITYPVVSYENTPLFIGAAAPNYIEPHLQEFSWWYKGWIDDVIIMEKVLNKEEIDLFNSDIVRRFTLAKYKFTLENINRFKVWDGSGNGNHALLYQDFNVNDIQSNIINKLEGE
jgi:hypothetical protein